MSRTDAYIKVSCDKCGQETEADLCALAGRGWDDRYVDAELRRDGWVIDKASDVCADCADEAKDAAE